MAATPAVSVTPHMAHAAPIDLYTATFADLNAAFKAGTLTSEKLTQAYLARIDACEKKGPMINSIIYLNPKALLGYRYRWLDSQSLRGWRSGLHQAHAWSVITIYYLIGDRHEDTSTPLSDRTIRFRSLSLSKRLTLTVRHY